MAQNQTLLAVNMLRFGLTSDRGNPRERGFSQRGPGAEIVWKL